MVNNQLPLPPISLCGSTRDTKLDSNVINRSRNYSYLKVIITNNLVEIYTPENPYLLNRVSSGGRSKEKLTDDNSNKRKEEYKRRTATKAFNTVKRLAVANFSDIPHAKFLTLTLKTENDFDISDLKACNKKQALFIKDLRKLYPTAKYLVVVEFQKRNAVHYHILTDIPFTHFSVIQDLWNYGSIDIEAVKSANHIGVYVTKYFTKNVNDPRLKGFRLYHASRNLTKPRTFYLDKADRIKYLLEKNNIKPTFESNYKSENNGNIGFREYLLEFPLLKNI